jgi:hypothetical protein
MSRIGTSTDMGSEKYIETVPIISLSPWFLHMSVKMHYIIMPGKSFGFSFVAASRTRLQPGSTTVVGIKFIGGSRRKDMDISIDY